MQFARVRSLTDDLDEHPLVAAAVELSVEDLLPRAEVETAVSHRDDHLASHDLALQVSIPLSSPVRLWLYALGLGS